MANEHYIQIILSSSSEGFKLEREKDLHRLFYTLIRLFADPPQIWRRAFQ